MPGLMNLWRSIRDVYDGIFLAPYRSAIRRAHRSERDLFLALVFADQLGIPHPVSFYTLELYPELIAQYHEWHVRMGMPRAPEGGYRCC